MRVFTSALRFASPERRPGRVPGILIGLLLLSAPVRTAQSQADSDAPRYLRSAIAEFQAGRADRAREHLSAARALDPQAMRRRPDAHKLDGLLLLTEGRDREAMPGLLAYLKARPNAADSAFLWYLLADYNLRHGDYSRAARAYARAAVAGSAQTPDPGETNPPTPWPALAPLTCPGDPLATAAQQETFWKSREFNPLHRPLMYGELWQRRLESHEIALAAFAARLYQRQSRARPTGADRDPTNTTSVITIEESDRMQAILLDRISRPEVRERLGDDLARLMAAPDEAVHHQRCLQKLENLENRQLSAIERGALTAGRRRLGRAREFLTRMHFARMAYLRDASGLYRFGVYLLRSARKTEDRVRRIRAIQALHALRGAFAARIETASGTLASMGVEFSYSRPGQLRIREQILHRLGEAYALLGRVDDRDTLVAIADLFADAADRAPAAGGANAARAASEFRRQVIKRCGENLHNREALLILIGASSADRAAEGPRPPRTAEYYRAKLLERDQKFEEAELLSAFAP